MQDPGALRLIVASPTSLSLSGRNDATGETRGPDADLALRMLL